MDRKKIVVGGIILAILFLIGMAWLGFVVKKESAQKGGESSESKTLEEPSDIYIVENGSGQIIPVVPPASLEVSNEDSDEMKGDPAPIVTLDDKDYQIPVTPPVSNEIAPNEKEAAAPEYPPGIISDPGGDISTPAVPPVQ